MQSFFARMRQLLGGLSLGQQLGLGGIALGTMALLIGMAYWSNQPDYTLLFGDLQPSDANRVVQTLREEGISYELKDRGTAVYVPRASVHELRLRFSSEGIIQEGQTGYELFDQGTLGMTDFMQKLNSKRALEGELAQTISQIGQVQKARVHLVKPERNPFREEESKASASVVLGLGGSSLSQAQVQGISELVSGAVEELGPAQVTIVDADGNMLSDPKAGNENIQLTSTQLEMRRSVEQQLSEQGRSMLKKVLGPGNAAVRVSAELDFDRTVTTRNTIDPESATIISEERTRKDTEDSTEGQSSSTSTSSVRNYEVSRTKKRSEESGGDVSRLTVSVMVDHKQTGGSEDNPTYAPRSEEEMQKIASIVKNAVGFDKSRGDSFTIQQTRFDGGPTSSTQVMREQGSPSPTRPYLRYGLIALAILAAIWMVRSIAQRLVEGGPETPAQLQSNQSQQRQLDQPAAESQVADDTSRGALQDADDEEEEEMVLADDMYTSKLSDEAKARIEARSEMFEEIQEQVEEHPEQTAELIRAWLVDDRSV
jgi:flagellar M-ring protein FliF